MSRGQITYYVYRAIPGTGGPFGVAQYQALARLPFTGVSFTKALNGAGSFSGKLNLASPQVQALNPGKMLLPWQTAIFVDIDGAIEWGGFVTIPNYKSSTYALDVAAVEAYGYLGSRLQALDYTQPNSGWAFWTSNPADPAQILAQVIYDAINVNNSLLTGMDVFIDEPSSNPNLIQFQASASQQQTVDAIVQSLVTSGYLVGCDFNIEWTWSAGSGSTPVPKLHVQYPLCGRAASVSQLAIPFRRGGGCIDYTWPVDGTRQINLVTGTASGNGGLVSIQGNDPEATTDVGFPLLEETVSNTNVSTQSQLDTVTSADLAQVEWPVITPVWTGAMFGPDLAITDIEMGDQFVAHLGPDPRFPVYETATMRIVGIKGTVKDAGLSEMELTVNMPPSTAPAPQPPLF